MLKKVADDEFSETENCIASKCDVPNLTYLMIQKFVWLSCSLFSVVSSVSSNLGIERNEFAKCIYGNHYFPKGDEEEHYETCMELQAI